ncbi:class I SAM-dependent methyltransferase [Acidiplasma cupricumulans]|uniref:class I SAM-dependent methyltransferase n=1 Tax=Acidiplasma cupricumulans TaxID=312540 RepID=UPI000780A496|nr:class I SAM-dependent methyltransferase [Acidiplasma cupricumulans]
MPDYYVDGEEKFGLLTTSFYSIFAWRLLKKLYNFAIYEFEGLSPETILDIGAGPGRLTAMVAKKFPDAQVYAIDPSKYMVDAERKLFKKENLRCTCEQGSSRDIPFNINFDLIFSSLSFHHWKDREKSLEYILGRLNKGGVFIIIEYYNEYYKSNLSAYKRHSLSKNMQNH